jgi:hypothetical protein
MKTLHPLKVLIVEDNPVTLEALTIYLETLGHQVVTAGNGLGAQVSMKAFHPDVAVVDHIMPALDVEGPKEFKRDTIASYKPTGLPDKAAVIWDADEDKLSLKEVAGQLLVAGPPGEYKLRARMVVLDKDGKTNIETVRLTFKILGVPDPLPPPGPKPPPGPTPDPTPTPDPSTLPAKQLNVLYDKGIRDYLNSKCVKGDDGKTPAWRIWDKDVDASKDDKVWGEAMTKAKGVTGFKTPWLVVSNGKTGFSGPLPADTTSALTLLKKYGDSASKAVLKGGRR